MPLELYAFAVNVVESIMAPEADIAELSRRLRTARRLLLVSVFGLGLFVFSMLVVVIDSHALRMLGVVVILCQTFQVMSASALYRQCAKELAAAIRWNETQAIAYYSGFVRF